MENDKRKKMRNQSFRSDNERERDRQQGKRQKEEESASVRNPKVKEVVGKIESDKGMRDGRLLLFCNDKKQQKAAVGLKTLLRI